MKIFFAVLAAILVAAFIVGGKVSAARKWEANAQELAPKIEKSTSALSFGDERMLLLEMRSLNAQAKLAGLYLADIPAFANSDKLVEAKKSAEWYVADYLKTHPNADLDELPKQ